METLHLTERMIFVILAFTFSYKDIKLFIFKCTFLGENWRDFIKLSIYNDHEFGYSELCMGPRIAI